MNAENRRCEPEKGFNAIINRIKADPKIPLIIAGSAAIAILLLLLFMATKP